MAYVINDDYQDKFMGTDIEFTDGVEAVLAFFAKTRATSYGIGKAHWSTGTPIPPEIMPTKARIIKGDAIYDWCAMLGGARLVSARFRDCVEELEPGQHGFYPITVEDKQRRAKPGPFFVFNVVGYIDSIIEAQSNLTESGRGFIDSWGYTPDLGPWRCALNATVIGNRACWTELRYFKQWFISDRLAALLQQRGLMGFSLNNFCNEIQT